MRVSYRLHRKRRGKLFEGSVVAQCHVTEDVWHDSFGQMG